MELKCTEKKVFAISSLILLSLMMTLIQLYTVKIMLLGVMLLTMSKHVSITKNLLFFYFCFVFFGLWGLLVALLNSATFPFSSVTVTVIWPLLFLPIIAQIRSQNAYNIITKVIFYTHLFIVVYDLIYAFSVILGFWFPNLYAVEIGFSFYETSSRMNFVNLNTLTFTTPVLFLLWITKYEFGVRYLLQTVVIVLTFFLLILSGRRSLMIQFILLPVMAFLCSSFFKGAIKRRLKYSLIFFLLGIVFILLSVYISNPAVFEGYYNAVLQAFDSEAEPIKFAQSEMLLKEFNLSPFWGHGFGTEFYEPYPGRMIFAYQFELQYHLKLAQTGVIGFLFLLMTYFGVFFYGLYLSKKNADVIFLFYLLGYFFVLVADATNPVLCSFDLMPPFFLCLAKINANSTNFIAKKMKYV